MGWFRSGVWVRVCVLLREGVGVGRNEVCFLRVVVIGRVRVLWRVLGVMGVRCVWVARSRMRQVAYVSSSPVRTYLRWDRKSDSA